MVSSISTNPSLSGSKINQNTVLLFNKIRALVLKQLKLGVDAPLLDLGQGPFELEDAHFIDGDLVTSYHFVAFENLET